MEPTINKIENGNPTYKKNISKEDDNISINNEKMEDEENIELNKLEGINKNMIVNASFSRLSHYETPYLNEQQSIIDALTKFDDYLFELESEIKLRQTQFNYYRDILLTFKEAE